MQSEQIRVGRGEAPANQKPPRFPFLRGGEGVGGFVTERRLWRMKRGEEGAAVKIARRSKPLAILGTARVVEGWKDSCMAYFRVCIDRANLERTQSTYIGDVNVQYTILLTSAYRFQ